MNEKLNIEKCITVAESPFSNGFVEHHNLIVAGWSNRKDVQRWEMSWNSLGYWCQKWLQNHDGHSLNKFE